jgi:hypothetical protein
MVMLRSCQAYVEASDESHRMTEPCGRKAEWWSDDLGEGTLWLCDDHCREAMSRAGDSAKAHRTETASTLPAPPGAP